jgi:hypothetical protein
LSIIVNERDVVWVGRATRRWQPKTKGIWWVTALLWDLLNKNTAFPQEII